jgi:hypothetical protein
MEGGAIAVYGSDNLQLVSSWYKLMWVDQQLELSLITLQTFTNCQFLSNSANNAPSVYLNQLQSVTFDSCLFEYNQVSQSGSDSQLGTVSVSSVSQT